MYILHNISTEILTAINTQVVQVALYIPCVLVQNIRMSSLIPCFQDCVPNVYRVQASTRTAVTFVRHLKILELLAIHKPKTRSFIGTEQTPFYMVVIPLHEKMREPKTIENIARMVKVPVDLTETRRRGRVLSMEVEAIIRIVSFRKNWKYFASETKSCVYLDYNLE